MLKVLRFELGGDTINTFAVPMGSKIASFHFQRARNELQCWVIGNPNAPSEQRRVLVVPTGSDIERHVSEHEQIRFIGTAITYNEDDYDEELVWHAFEITR